MVAAFVLGTSEIIGRNLGSDEAPPKRKVQFVRTGGDGGQDHPDPMNVVPQNAPPMLLPPTAEHDAPSYAQSARPFPPLNPQAAPELPWRVKEKAKAKAKGKEKAKEKEKRTRALTAEAEQQSDLGIGTYRWLVPTASLRSSLINSCETACAFVVWYPATVRTSDISICG
ncbi:hypothetical protein BC629DRAFT_1553236 [Irpex lacteus]|nr:hypothetical protein BC629DRAFT_1553236 [Irpex lacteus]